MSFLRPTPDGEGWVFLEDDRSPCLQSQVKAGFILVNKPWRSCYMRDLRMEEWAITDPTGRWGFGIPETWAIEILSAAGVPYSTTPSKTGPP